jgi:hypothetical protein
VYLLGFSRILLLGILIFKGLIARRLYKSFGLKGLKWHYNNDEPNYTKKIIHDHTLMIQCDKQT